MKSTSSRFADFIAAPNRAVGHVRRNGAWVARYTRDPDPQSPAGGVSSSARDMAQWLRLQLGRGTLDGKEVIAAKALDETHRPQIVNNPAANPMINHSAFSGLGWNVSYDENGRIRWGHSGGFNLGVATCVNILPTEQIGIVVLTNGWPIGMPEAACRTFLDLCLYGKAERDWLALFGPALVRTMAPDYGTSVDYAKPPAQPSPALSSAAYAGRYQNDLYGPIEIAADRSALLLKLGPKQAAFPLSHFARDTFTYQPTGENAYGPSAVTFTISADGKATSVTVENLDLHGQGTFRRT
jgi:CubicO group peptidase (beta-lactamase class C family)